MSCTSSDHERREHLIKPGRQAEKAFEREKKEEGASPKEQQKTKQWEIPQLYLVSRVMEEKT
jgi:hypothetical protein